MRVVPALPGRAATGAANLGDTCVHAYCFRSKPISESIRPPSTDRGRRRQWGTTPKEASMDVCAKGCVSLLLILLATESHAQDLVWRPSNTAMPPAAPPVADQVVLARPQPLTDADLAVEPPANLVRSQAPDVPPPPPYPPGGPVPGGATGPFTGPTPYNCGQANSNADLGFWSHCGENLRRLFTDTTGAIGGAFAPTQGRNVLQSDHTLDFFASPVTNPFYFQDPRALTEIKPLFIWQLTPSSNPIFAGGSDFVAGFSGSVAFTPWLSLVVNEVAWQWLDPKNGAIAGLSKANGFAQVQLGPQVTFIRDANTGTAAAFGLTFEIPVGSSQVLADTGTLSLRPYFSFAQHFGKFQYGSFNFMNTTGYDLSVDDQRNDFLFSSFHLDYDALDKHIFYPLVELNWIMYPFNGRATDLGFGGGDLYNFGSYGVAGHDELTVALGFRWKPLEALQFGLAAQMNVLPNTYGRHLDLFRLTADMIVRY